MSGEHAPLPQLIVATRSPAKVAELARLVPGLAAVGLPRHDISLKIEEEDEARTAGRVRVGTPADFVTIAGRKAVVWSQAIDDEQIVVATDGGLLIPALGNGWDPTRTRRFVAEGDDLDRATALLGLTEGLRGEDRRIIWREALAVARNGELLASWAADSDPGLLATDVDPAAIARGGGFWIPALWLCPEYGGRRLSDLSDSERASRVDHWSRLGVYLRRFLAGTGD